MSTKKEKMREFVKKRVTEIFEARSFKERAKLYSARKKLFDLLEKEIESYHKKNHSDMIRKQKTKTEDTQKEEIKKINVEQNNIYLAHYTSIETVYSILEQYQIRQEKEEYQKHDSQENKTDSIETKDDSEKNANISSGLRLYDAFSLNDPQEGQSLKKSLQKSYEWLKNMKQDTEAFVCSFVSGNNSIGDNLKFWQAYGKDGLGCSIQIPLNSRNGVFGRVLYGEKVVQKAKDHFKDYFELGKELYNLIRYKDKKTDFATEFLKKFDKISFLYKNFAYENEQEYRFVIITVEENDIKYHFKNEGPYLRRYVLDENLEANKILTTGSQVTIGPRVEGKEKLCQNLEKLAKAKGLYGPQFSSSRIPYRKVW